MALMATRVSYLEDQSMRLDQAVERGVVDRQRIDRNTVARSQRELKPFERALLCVESFVCGLARTSCLHRLDEALGCAHVPPTPTVAM